jgi:hypothetical protein
MPQNTCILCMDSHFLLTLNGIPVAVYLFLELFSSTMLFRTHFVIYVIQICDEFINNQDDSDFSRCFIKGTKILLLRFVYEMIKVQFLKIILPARKYYLQINFNLPFTVRATFSTLFTLFTLKAGI